MSFTRQVKMELVHHDQRAPCCSRAELAAMLLLRGYLTIRAREHILSLELEHMALARHLYSLFKETGAGSAAVLRKQERRLGKKCYLLQLAGRERIASLLQELDLNGGPEPNYLLRVPPKVPAQRCCRRAFLRGAFLAGGSISASAGAGYHLEINCGSRETALALRACLAAFDVPASLRRRGESYFLYQKNSEAIADFLRIIEAGAALLALESARVIRSMRSQVNRLVNCETANLDKIVATAQQQLALIDQVERHIGLENLSPALREAALMRRRYPEASLRELGRMFDPPLSKSAVNYRFRQLSLLVERKEDELKDNSAERKA